MSEKLCTLRGTGGGGGRYTETSLWTNSAPTTNFSAQTVTLSDDITNYDYIKVDYTYSATITSKYSVMMPVSVFTQDIYPAVNQTPTLMLGVYSSNYTTRNVYYVSSTSVRFGSATNVNSQGTADNRAIPTAIYGVKLS